MDLCGLDVSLGIWGLLQVEGQRVMCMATMANAHHHTYIVHVHVKRLSFLRRFFSVSYIPIFAFSNSSPSAFDEVENRPST